MSKTAGFLRGVPRRSKAIFLLGVFFIFSTIGLASDMSQLGNQPVVRFVLSVFLTSTFAVLYAVAGFSLRGNGWKAVVPLFLVHMVILNVLSWWMPGSLLSNTMDANMIARLHTTGCLRGRARDVKLSGQIYRIARPRWRQGGTGEHRRQPVELRTPFLGPRDPGIDILA